ncbi:DedA family protein [soil metagenome]
MFDLIVGVIAATGVLGVALLMFAENVFPPLPSEVIMPLAGFAAARGDFSLWSLVLAGTIGAVLGAWVWYEIGRRVGLDGLKRWSGSHGRWLTMSPKDVDRAAEVFRRFGVPAVLLGRLIPTVRTFISVPAGVTRMRVVIFLTWTAIGTAVFTFILAYAGYRLEAHYDRVEAWLNPVATAILVIAVLGYLYRVLTFNPRALGASVDD